MPIGIQAEINLDTLARKVRDAKDRSMYRGARKVYRISQELVPVDTGDLKASGTVKKIDEASYTVEYGEGLPDGRAPAQEFGAVKLLPNGKTVITVAQPYLTPAVEQANVVTEIKTEFFRELA